MDRSHTGMLGGIPALRLRGALSAGGALGVLALLAGMTLGDPTAQATFPGSNGKLACEGQRGAPLLDPENNATKESRSEIFTINPDGTGETVLTDNRVRDGDPAFSPGGAEITFESFREGPDSEFSRGASEAFKLTATGSALRLTENGAPEDRSTNWSPDGTRIAFHSTRDSALLPIGTSPFEIYVMNPDGSNETRITENVFQDALPQFSPDGSKIAFTSNRDAGDFEIYTMNPDGSNVQRITNSPLEDSHPTWSPDGRQLTFHSRRSGNLDIFRQNADGSGAATPVTNTPQSEFFPVWSPDGKRIAFSGNTADVRDFEVYHVNAVDGSGQVRVTNSPGFDGRCDWNAVRAAQQPQQPQGPPQAFVPPPAGGCPSGTSVGVMCQPNGSGGLTITGTAGNDRIVGSSGPDVIRCGDGNDVVFGGPGNDVIRCGAGNDTVSGGAGNDLVDGESGNDRVTGGSGNDRLLGGSGNDSVGGGTGNDVIGGGSGNDRLSGNEGADRTSGAGGNDRVSGNSGNDRIDGGDASDRLDGNGGNDRIAGGRTGNDRLAGGTGSDRLSGGFGSDRLVAGTGRRDVLFGGRGNDRLNTRDRRGGDVANCGENRRDRDRVAVDRRDRVRGCERVSRN